MAIQTEALKQTLKTDILEILNKPISEDSKDGDVKQRFAESLANAIGDRLDAWIKTAVVTVPAGIPVATAGSPTAQSGATTAPATGTIS